MGGICGGGVAYNLTKTVVAMRRNRVTVAKENVVDRLGLPKDLLLGAINIEVTGQYEVYVENYSSIIEYTDRVIKIRGKGLSVKIGGKNLVIDWYTKNDMRIVGVIKEVIYY